MPPKRRSAMTRRLVLLAAVAAWAVALPLGLASAQQPAQVSLLNVPFRGVDAPGSTFDLVQSVIDFAPGAKSGTTTTTSQSYLSALEGELTVEVDGKPETAATGKGLAVAPGSKVVTSNASTTQGARLFVSTLAGVAAIDQLHQPSGAGIKVFGTARRTLTNVPAVVDVIQAATRYDPEWKTPNHTMNERHLFLMLTGTTDFGYLDGRVERFAPGQQAVMYEGQAGWMRNSTAAPSTFVVTWVATPGKPLTTGVAAPAAPSTGTGRAQDGGQPWGFAVSLALALAGAAATLGLTLRRHRATG